MWGAYSGGVEDARAFVEGLLREKGVKPMLTPDDPLGADIFESVEELYEFLEYTYAARRDEISG